MNIALILAGGTGSRVGENIPKQYIIVSGKPIISYCLERVSSFKNINKIHIVADETWQGFIKENFDGEIAGFSVPGKNRQMSILNGLTDILKYAEPDDNVIIHDAARPLVSEKLVDDCINALECCEGVLPTLPMKDTVYFSADGKKISSLLERNKIFAGQAPEGFKLKKYYDANIALLPDEILKINGSTEPAVKAGLNVSLIAGDENNFKITTKTDLERFISVVSESGI